MLKVNIESIGEVVIVQCDGRIVQSEAAFKLRAAVTAQKDSRIVLDLSEVYVLEDGGLGMLIFLQRWDYDHDIRLKLFNPSKAALDRLKKGSTTVEFDIPTLHEWVVSRRGSSRMRAAKSLQKDMLATLDGAVYNLSHKPLCNGERAPAPFAYLNYAFR